MISPIFLFNFHKTREYSNLPSYCSLFTNCNILEDEKIKDNLLEQIKNTYKNSNTMKEKMKNQKEIGNIKNIVNRIIELQNNK